MSTTTGSCQYCGEPLRPNSMFCFRCGQLIHSIEDRVTRAAAVPRVAPVERPAAPVFGGPSPLPPRWSPPRLSDNVARRVAEAAPAQPAAPAVSAAPAPAPMTTVSDETGAATTVVLTFSTGDRVIVVGNAVIGRQPEAEALTSGAQSVQIDDPKRSISRVHLVLTVSETGVTVTDPGSANGSSVERAGAVTRLIEGQPTAVLPGDRLWLGDVSADLSRA